MQRMTPGSRIYVAGHRGLVGSALVRRLERAGFQDLILRTRSELDLCSQAEVRSFFEAERPEFVFLAAAKVGGIHANSAFPADFIYENLIVEANTFMPRTLVIFVVPALPLPSSFILRPCARA